jgi:uncharacterized protein (DUF302 family)
LLRQWQGDRYSVERVMATDKRSEVNMTNHPAHQTTFSGTRVRFESALAFDRVLDNLRALVGRPSMADLVKLSSEPSTKSEFASKVESYAGESDFLLFLELDHGAWIGKFGIERKMVRWILGNPMIAITMIKHDITAGLFVPVELLLVENESGEGSSIIYILPSSLMATGNAELTKAAKALDAKLEALVAKVV